MYQKQKEIGIIFNDIKENNIIIKEIEILKMILWIFLNKR